MSIFMVSVVAGQPDPGRQSRSDQYIHNVSGTTYE